MNYSVDGDSAISGTLNPGRREHLERSELNAGDRT